MGTFKVLKNPITGEIIYPKTHIKCVFDDDGKTLEELLGNAGPGGGTVAGINIPIGDFSPGYLNADGSASTSTAWAHSGFVPICGGIPYKLTTSGWNSSFGVSLYAYYSSPQDDHCIECYINKGPTNFNEEVITPPVGARYIRFSAIDPSHADKFKLSLSLDDGYKALNALLDYKSDQATNVGFAFPKYLDCPKGMQTTIYLDGISGECDFNEDDIVIAKKGFNANIIKTKEALIYTPGASDAECTLTVKRVDENAKVLYQNDIILRPVRRDGGDGSQKNICISGDSLIEVTAIPVIEAIGLLNTDGDYQINTIGTKSKVDGGVTYRHEGSAGWTWGRYLDTSFDSYNPFMTNGELNFQTYMTTNFPSIGNGKIDIFLMSLGTNDINVFGVTMETIIANAKKFIDVLLSEEKGFPDCKVIIGMPGMGAPAGDASYNARAFRRKINLLNRTYVETFDNGNYHPNVTLVMHGAFIDRYNCYPYTDIVASEFVPGVTVRKYNDFLHPKNEGYRQFGRGYYSKLRCVLNDLL